jgi:hypothetical protein
MSFPLDPRPPEIVPPGRPFIDPAPGDSPVVPPGRPFIDPHTPRVEPVTPAPGRPAPEPDGPHVVPATPEKPFIEP